jgi:hypothetical protein
MRKKDRPENHNVKPFGRSNEIQDQALTLVKDLRSGNVTPELSGKVNAALKTAAREIDHEISKERNQIAAARIELDYLKTGTKPKHPALNLQGVIADEPTKRLGRKHIGHGAAA